MNEGRKERLQHGHWRGQQSACTARRGGSNCCTNEAPTYEFSVYVTVHTINRDDQDILLAQYTGPFASSSWYANATLHYMLLMKQYQNVVLTSKFPPQRFQNFVIIQPVKYKIQN
jgi:hypothetical protein